MNTHSNHQYSQGTSDFGFGFFVFLAFVLSIIGFGIFLLITKGGMINQKTPAELVEFSVQPSTSQWKVVGLLDDGHVAIILPANLTKVTDSMIQVHGILASNGLGAKINAIVETKHYHSPYVKTRFFSGTKGDWYEIIKVVD